MQKLIVYAAAGVAAFLILFTFLPEEIRAGDLFWACCATGAVVGATIGHAATSPSAKKR